MADEKKSWSGWTRDLAFFGMGFVAGGSTAIAVGHATDSIRSPEEQQAARAAAEAKAKAGK